MAGNAHQQQGSKTANKKGENENKPQKAKPRMDPDDFAHDRDTGEVIYPDCLTRLPQDLRMLQASFENLYDIILVTHRPTTYQDAAAVA